MTEAMDNDGVRYPDVLTESDHAVQLAFREGLRSVVEPGPPNSGEGAVFIMQGRRFKLEYPTTADGEESPVEHEIERILGNQVLTRCVVGGQQFHIDHEGGLQPRSYRFEAGDRLSFMRDSLVGILRRQEARQPRTVQMMHDVIGRLFAARMDLLGLSEDAELEARINDAYGQLGRVITSRDRRFAYYRLPREEAPEELQPKMLGRAPQGIELPLSAASLNAAVSQAEALCQARDAAKSSSIDRV